MALVDWRRLLEADAHQADGATIALEVTDAGADVPRAFRHRLHVETFGDVALDYYALGEYIDQLREAHGVLLALQGDPVAAAALTGLVAGWQRPVGEPSE